MGCHLSIDIAGVGNCRILGAEVCEQLKSCAQFRFAAMGIAPDVFAEGYQSFDCPLLVIPDDVVHPFQVLEVYGRHGLHA